MAQPLTDNSGKLSNLQIELLKSMKYMADEKQLSDIRSLIRFYFANQLDKAIEKEENERGYTAEIYESWLKNASGTKPGE